MDKQTVHMLTVEENGGQTRKGTQYLAAVAAAIGAVIAGTILAWTSPALPQLTDKLPANATNASDVIVATRIAPAFNSSNVTDTELRLTIEQSSIVSSILAIGALVGALPVGVLAQKIGRKPTILLLTIPFMLHWLLTIFANGAGMLIAARFFAGLSTGGICVAAPMYIGEIAETSIRGSLGAFFQLFLTVGILFTFVIGAYTHWRVLSIICAAIPPLLIAVFWWMPETPQYLLGKNRRREAERALRWLRGCDADISDELQDMQREVDEASRQQASVKSMLTNRTSVMALVCSLGLMLFQQFSGINAVIFYTNTIFESAGSNIDPSLATIIVGIVQTIATLISSLLIEKAGRKILLIQSCVIMGLCLIILGVYFKLQTDKYDVSSVGWIPLVCLVLFIISFSLGFGPIPWMMMAELFPVEYRGSASGVAVIFNWSLVFIVTLCFPIMKDAIGIYSCFWFFAGFMVICTFFVVILIPETKGKTVSQIQAMLGGR